MSSNDTHLQIGSLLFEGVDQIDLTGPFEVFSRIPNSTYRIFGKTAGPVRDIHGLRLIADAILAGAPQLDVLHVPGGVGQEDLMDDEEVLAWIRRQSAGARCVFSVCTGALLLGAAGLLKGRRATTHWAALEFLPYFGAVAVDERVVIDGRMVFAAGVTAGLDGALRVAAKLRGDEIAETIQLHMAYAPEPPFHSGTPATAPASVLARAEREIRKISSRRRATARRAATKLGIDPDMIVQFNPGKRPPPQTLDPKVVDREQEKAREIKQQTLRHAEVPYVPTHPDAAAPVKPADPTYGSLGI